MEIKIKDEGHYIGSWKFNNFEEFEPVLDGLKKKYNHKKKEGGLL